jgi:hypothetical protein
VEFSVLIRLMVYGSRSDCGHRETEAQLLKGWQFADDRRFFDLRWSESHGSKSRKLRDRGLNTETTNQNFIWIVRWGETS